MPKKSNYVIFALKLSVYALLGLVASNSVLYLLTRQDVGGSYYNVLVMLTAAKHTAVTVTYTVSAVIFGAVLVLALVSATILTHRVSGPMHRFEKILSSLAAGDFTVEARLRSSDYLTEQAKELGEAIGAWKGRLAALDAQAGQLREGLSALSGGAGGQEKKAALKRMRETAAQVNETLSFFKAE